MTLLPEIRDELYDAAARRAKARAGRHRVRALFRMPHLASIGLRAGLRSAPLVLGIVIAAGVAVFALELRHGHANRPAGAAGHSHRPRPPRSRPPTAQSREQQNDISKAQAAAIARDPACAVRYNVGATFSQQSPGRALLSVLAVLRQPAPPPDAKLLRRLGFTAGAEVYVNYIRRARSEFGKSFYIIPEGNPSGRGSIPNRCYAEMAAALDRLQAHVSKTTRAQTLSIQSEQFASQRADYRHAASVCFDVVSAHGKGTGVDGGCQPVQDFLRHVTGGLDNGEGDRAGGTILSGIVPDGVATITLNYAAGDGMPARTLNAAVVKNVVVVKVPARTAHQPFPREVLWRGANGRVIMTLGK